MTQPIVFSAVASPVRPSAVRLGQRRLQTAMPAQKPSRKAASPAEVSPQATAQAHPKPTQPPGVGEKFVGALKAVGRSARDRKWWLQELAISSVIAIATCWLPGSQLFTIPLWLGISSLLRFGPVAQAGWKQPRQVDALFPAHRDPRKAAGKDDCHFMQKAWASLRAGWDGVKGDFRDHWKRNSLIGAAIALATCWMPGVQLLLIPGWFCISAATAGARQGVEAFSSPAAWLKPKASHLLKAGKAEAE